MKNTNQKGLTLIEVLAAIVILAFVLVSFINFFSQSLSHSRITEDKLTAINLAERILVEIKEIKDLDSKEAKEFLIALNTDSIKINDRLYYVNANFSENLINENRALNLRKISVKIYKDKDMPNRILLTELYSYK